MLAHEKKRMDEFEILPASGADFHEINVVIEEHYAAPPIYFRPVLFSATSDVEQSERNIIFIAKDSCRIVGFIALHCHESFIKTDNAAEFEIVIHPDYRKQGLGKKLLDRAIEYASNKTKLNQLNAKIPANNDASKRLCEKCGFQLSYNEQKGSLMILEITHQSKVAQHV